VLKGALDDFALTDIFRLISLAKKTGRLEVLRQAGRGAVLFGSGDVLYAESSLVREPLGQKLIRAGALTEGQLRRALDEHAATGQRLGRVLLSSGWVSQTDLEDAIRGQTEDAVFDLLRWEVGEFAWTSGERIDAEVPVAVSVENLIMEASRRLDELDIITRKIASVDAVMAMAAKPPEGAVEINITPDEWRLLVLVNGSRSVANIAQTVGVDDFDALKTLYGMLSAGLVEVVTPAPGGTSAPDVFGEARLEGPPPPATVEPEPAEDAGPAAAPGPEPAEDAGPAAAPGPEPSPAPEPGPVVAIEPVMEPEVEVERVLAPADDPFAPDVGVDTPEAGEGIAVPGVASEVLPHERDEAGGAPSQGVDQGAEAEPELEVTFVEEEAPAEPSEPAVPEEWTNEPEPTEPASPQAWTDEPEPSGPATPQAWTEEGEPPQGARPEGWADEPEPPRPANEPEPVLSAADEAEPDLSPVEPDAGLDDAGPEFGPDRDPVSQEPAATETDMSEPREAPRLERSAAVRELAGLWGDSDQPARRPSAQRPADPGPADPDARKRVEDDDDINRGLISKLIDGVKGL
jgi:hypothetical protein